MDAFRAFPLVGKALLVLEPVSTACRISMAPSTSEGCAVAGATNGGLDFCASS